MGAPSVPVVDSELLEDDEHPRGTHDEDKVCGFALRHKLFGHVNAESPL